MSVLLKQALLGALISYSCSFFAQTNVKGVVFGKDGETVGNVLLFADVNAQHFETKTSANGSFELNLPGGEYFIFLVHPDYEKDSIAFNSNSVANPYLIDLVPKGTQIEEVIIRVGKFDKPLEEQTVSMEIIKPHLIESKNTRSIETVLDQTPGLNILDGEPQIRGGSGFTFGVGSKVAVLVDDMPMLSGDAGRPEWGFIPVENISQVEVIKGAASVLSGSAALSGSVNIRTAYPTTIPLTKINLYSGIYGTQSTGYDNWYSGRALISGANLLHSVKKGNVDLVFGSNFNYDHGYIGPPVTDTLVQKDTVSNFSNREMSSKRARINGSIMVHSKKHSGLSYGINGNIMLSRSNMIFAWLNDTSGIYRAYPGAMFLVEQLIFHVDPTMSFRTGSNDKHSIRTRVLRTVNNMSANQSNQTTVLYADYQFKTKLESLWNTELIAGLTGTHTYSYANIYAGSGSKTNQLLNLSGYTQLEKKIKDRLTLSFGGRLEHFDLNDGTHVANKPVLRAGSSFRIHKATYLRTSYGQGYRFPTITERYIKTGVGNFGVFPNPDLQAESSWNAEFGVKQGMKFGGLFALFDAAFFWQEYQNTIEYMFGIWDAASTTSFAGFKFLNTGRSRVQGIDISFAGEYTLKKTHNFKFLIGYNYIVPKTLNPDYVYAIDDFNRKFSYNSTSLDSNSRILKYRFLHNVKADVEWTYNKKLAIGVSVKYFSKIVNMDRIIKEFEDFTANAPYIQDIRYMDYFNSHRHGNLIFDARVSYPVNKKQKVAIIGTNIFNKSYSLRPLKIEQPLTLMLQYSFRLGED